MKRKVLYIILIVVLFSFGFLSVYADDYSYYNNFISQYNEFATEGGYVQENNVTTIEIALGIIAQNKELVNHLLSTTCSTRGSDYDALRDFIGVDEKGNIKLGSDKQTDVASAFYKVAYILDTYNGMSKSLGSCPDEYTQISTSFKDNTGKSKYNNSSADYYLHVWVGQYGGAADKITSAHFFEQNNVSSDVWQGLNSYYCEFVNENSMNSVYTNDNENIKFDEKALLDDFKNLKISIGSGDSNKIGGETTEELLNNTYQRIAEEELITMKDETVDNNIYNQTGTDMATVREEVELMWGKVDAGDTNLSMALDHLLERAKALKDKGENENVSGMTSVVTDIINIVSSIGRYIMYALILFFGVKTIWEGVEGKAKFKEVLPLLLVGVIFFWTAPGIVSLIKTLFEVSTSKSDEYLSLIFATVVYILRIVAFGGIIFTGVKLMFGSADKKADAKSSLVPVLIGSILVFASSIVVSIVLSISSDVTSENSNSGNSNSSNSNSNSSSTTSNVTYGNEYNSVTEKISRINNEILNSSEFNLSESIKTKIRGILYKYENDSSMSAQDAINEINVLIKTSDDSTITDEVKKKINEIISGSQSVEMNDIGLSTLSDLESIIKTSASQEDKNKLNTIMNQYYRNVISIDDAIKKIKELVNNADESSIKSETKKQLEALISKYENK